MMGTQSRSNQDQADQTKFGLTETDPKILMKRAKEGETEAFESLYRMYYLPVYRYIYLRVKNREETEDLTSTVFLKVYYSLDKYQERNREILAYFFTVARNCVIDHWRKKKEVSLNSRFLFIPLTDGQDGPEEKILKDEKAASVRQAIQSLNEVQQEVVILKFISDLSNREIAQVISKSEEAVRQIQCRALKELKEKLKSLGVV
jgi:RNA polymerase sigma-70 factor (ECF subfamily)